MASFTLDGIHWLAVVVAAVAMFVVGGVWYGAIFGKAWLAVHRIPPERAAAMQASMPRAFAIMFACDAARAVGLAVLLPALGVTSTLGGVVAGIVLWGAIAGPFAGANDAAHRRPLAAWLLDAGHQALALVAGAAILAAWN